MSVGMSLLMSISVETPVVVLVVMSLELSVEQSVVTTYGSVSSGRELALSCYTTIYPCPLHYSSVVDKGIL